MGGATGWRNNHCSQDCRRVEDLPISVLTGPAALAVGHRLLLCHCREAYTVTGYTPFLSFEVADLQDSLQKLLQHGAVMDGPVKYADQGKVRWAGLVSSSTLSGDPDSS